MAPPNYRGPGSAVDSKVAVPHNTTPVPDGACNGLLVVVAGNVEWTTVNGTNVGPYAFPVGAYIDIAITHVRVGTSATVLCLY